MGTDYAALFPDPKVTVKGLSCPTTILVDLDLVPNRTEHSIGADRADRHTQSTGPVLVTLPVRSRSWSPLALLQLPVCLQLHINQHK